MAQEALIIKNISNQYTVYFGNETHLAVAMGKLRLGKRPIVGDRVAIEMIDNKWVIQEVLERKNALQRPLVANVDQALIVMSLKEPDFSYRLVDRLIFLISYEGIEPIILINKTDLDDENQLDEIVKEYEKGNYKVYTSNRLSKNVEFIEIFKDKITVLAGQSGVGKSSLINRIDQSFQLQTQEISKVLGRGKHTTRHNELHQIADGWVADTPGFSSLDFKLLDEVELAATVPDFKDKWAKCKFRNCIHLKEPGCAVKEAVEKNEISKSRYQHYVEVIELIRESKL